jgi:hypothetical protein
VALYAVPSIRKSLHQIKSAIRNTWFQQWGGALCDGLGWNIMVQYFVCSIITLHGRITARECLDRLSNQVHPMIQTLFPKKDAVFEDDNVPFTHLELFNQGLISRKVKYNIFLGLHNNQI